MVELTDSLKCLYTATVEENDSGEYVVQVPASEVSHGTIHDGESYRVVLLDHDDASADGTTHVSDADSSPSTGTGRSTSTPRGPPVEEGEVRDVTIETLGDQGDGIAKIERGYVVIVPDAGLGEEVTVEIATVRENVSFAEIVE